MSQSNEKEVNKEAGDLQTLKNYIDRLRHKAITENIKQLIHNIDKRRDLLIDRLKDKNELTKKVISEYEGRLVELNSISLRLKDIMLKQEE